MIKQVKTLTYTSQDQEVLDVANQLAELENRKPHDSIRILIIEAGNQKIKELTAPSEMQSSSSDELLNSKSDSACQE